MVMFSRESVQVQRWSPVSDTLIALSLEVIIVPEPAFLVHPKLPLGLVGVCNVQEMKNQTLGLVYSRELEFENTNQFMSTQACLQYSMCPHTKLLPKM